jgi:PAS domain S-box-containing protein
MSPLDGPRSAAPRAPHLAALVAQVCGVLTVSIGISALIGWIAGIEALHRVSTAFVPTAPSTALTCVLLGAAVFALDRWPERRAARIFVDAAAILVCAVTALLIAQFVGGFDVGLEPAVSSTTQTFQGAQVGRMSPLAAAGFLLAALSLIAVTTYPSETAAGRRAAAGMGFGTFAIGVAALAGYALGAPLLYHSVVVPVALPTAAGLSLLGAGLLTIAIRAPRPGVVVGAEARPRRRPRLMRYVPATLGAGATALLTFVAAGIVRQLDQTRLQEAFESKAKSVAAALQSDIDQGLTNVRSAAAAVEIDEAVTRSEFRLFAAASRQLHGGAIAVAWVPRVPLEMRARFEAAARRDGRPGFSVTERGPAGRLVAVGRRNEYLPVLYVEPSAGLETLLGFDAGTEPAAANALARARDANATAVSDGFSLVPDPPGQVTVVVVQPLFHARPPRSAVAERGTLRGYAVGIVRLKDVVREVDPGLEAAGIALTVRDLRGERPEPLYGGPPASPAHPFLSHAETLAVADRRWQAVFVPLAAYASLRQHWSAWALLGGGLLFAFLIGAHLFGMEGYASDLEIARETLHTSEARFRAISDSAVDGIITIDAVGTIVHCNAAAVREFGYEDGGLLGRKVQDLVPPSHFMARVASLEQHQATGVAPVVGEVLELAARHRDGSEFPIEVSLATWETPEGRFATAIIRNISDRKRSREEREQLIVKLQDALANVKTLSGLMPICAWCKKIRDDKGYWTQLESYLSQHTTAEFTHGMCPDCKRKFQDGEV